MDVIEEKKKKTLSSVAFRESQFISKRLIGIWPKFPDWDCQQVYVYPNNLRSLTFRFVSMFSVSIRMEDRYLVLNKEYFAPFQWLFVNFPRCPDRQLDLRWATIPLCLNHDSSDNRSYFLGGRWYWCCSHELHLQYFQVNLVVSIENIDGAHKSIMQWQKVFVGLSHLPKHKQISKYKTQTLNIANKNKTAMISFCALFCHFDFQSRTHSHIHNIVDICYRLRFDCWINSKNSLENTDFQIFHWITWNVSLRILQIP